MSDKGWRFLGNEREYVDTVLNSGFGASESGSMNEKLETKFAKLHNKKFAISANSGTSTLHMALKAFGVGAGDEVIIPALTVAMPGFAVWQCGAIPIYADVSKNTFLLNPNDVIIAISCSGDSPNITKAVDYAKELGCVIIGLTGFEGGYLRKVSDVSFHVDAPKDDYGLVEDLHMILDHIIYSYYIQK